MSDYKIPEEYSKADFGFSAIDEATYKAQQAVNEVTPPSIDENDVNRAILNALSPLEDKIDLLLKQKRASDDENVQMAITGANEDAAGKVSQLEEIIMPLLVNLLKTADKEYIHWPNRENAINEQIKKVLKITRG
jgi:hypothetical protein